MKKYSLNMLKNVIKAYNVLSDSNSRVQYDMKLPVFNLTSENVYSKYYSISSMILTKV